MFLGLRTVIYPAPDLAAARAGVWVRSARPPHFDRPYRVGFDVGGSKLGLDPDAAPADRAVPDRGVPDATAVRPGNRRHRAPHVAVASSIGPGPGRSLGAVRRGRAADRTVDYDAANPDA